jgi:hypothetical protein
MDGRRASWQLLLCSAQCCSRAGLAGEATVDCSLLVSVFGDLAQRQQASVIEQRRWTLVPLRSNSPGKVSRLCAGSVRCHANASLPRNFGGRECDAHATI